MKKILVIGVGSIGLRHIENIRELSPGAKFILLRRSTSGRTLSADLNAEIVNSIDAALLWQPDIAVVCSPSSFHLQDLIPLVEKNIPFYIEKPVITTREELDVLQSYSIDCFPVSMSGCNLRFLPSLKLMKVLITQGIIGNVIRATLQAGQWLPDWRPHQDYRKSYSADRRMGGGVILDLVHEFDMARFLFGEFSKVYALSGQYSSLDISSEDTACVILQESHESMLVSLNLDYISRVPIRRYEVVGDKASLCWDLQEEKLELISESKREIINCGAGAFDISATYMFAMREFFGAVVSGSKTSQSIHEGMRSAELVIRAREAAGL